MSCRIPPRLLSFLFAVLFAQGSVLGWVLSCVLSGAPKNAEAQLPTSFDTQVSLRLCPEYRLGGVTLDVKYTQGTDPTLRTPVIVSSSIDGPNNRASYVLRFPANFGTTPFTVFAFCLNNFGVGRASNGLAVTNCDNIKRFDNDLDGMTNNLEDVNCDNFFSPGDRSNPDNLDTDGDGFRDILEVLSVTDPTNPGSSPRPYVFSSAPFDPDGDRNSNALIWRTSARAFYIRDLGTPGSNTSIAWGLPGDIPITYRAADSSSHLGVVRITNNQYRWLLRGPGFRLQNGAALTDFSFGIFGDNLVFGPWQRPGVTNPAVARLYQNQWQFVILNDDGSVRFVSWGGNGDIPRVQDYDGDGVYDIAVFRPTEQKTYVIRSTNGQSSIYTFGTGTADFTPRGDFTGDGIDDITFWEPVTGLFQVMTSDNGFDDARARAMDPLYYRELQLGLYFVHLPLNWQSVNNRLLFSVVDHNNGFRFIRPGNLPESAPQVIQWGLPGDHQG